MTNELNPMDKQPIIGQKCVVTMEKEMIYLGKDDDGHSKWREDQNPAKQKFLGWKLI